MKFNRVTALLLSLTLAFSLAACGQGASSASSASSSSAASSAAAETKTEEQLLAEENEILSANDALWEKAKRLRNVHLEKSAVTGVRHPSRSPMTAKVPLKVHLRLRFQNLGKPRTAGLCGRAAGACDCGPLSCAKIERPSPSKNPA